MSTTVHSVPERPSTMAWAPGTVVGLCDVVSTVDGFPVLTGADLSVQRGELILVSGANGAGKTSLLRLIAGLLPVTTGQAVVLGHDLASDPKAHRRQVAFVAHETFCYEELTIRRNLALHARMSGATTRDIDRVLSLLGLTDLASVVHVRLSTGQRRRCALAVGLLRAVDLLLLDEPHSGLDPDARDTIDRVVREVQRGGVTVIFASHELDRARNLADREVVMVGGSVLK